MAFSGKGFIIDSPKVLLQTSSGNSHLATAAQGTVTLGGESIEVMGGWSFYNLAEIDTKKTLAISLTDAQWDLDALWLSSGGAKTVAASNYYYYGIPYTVDASAYTITLPHVVVANSIEINGFTEETEVGATPVAATFTVSIGASTTTVIFHSSQASEVLYPHYYIATAATTNILTVQTTDFASSGSAIVQFPLYSDADASESTIIAYVQIEVYKVKIMPTYEFSGQYKQASQFKLDLKGLDPRRDDGNMYQLIVYEV